MDSADLGIMLADWGCPDDNPGCDGDPSEALGFHVVTVDNSAVMPPNYRTFDLVAEVGEGDDWTATLAEAELTDSSECVFYQEPTYGEDYPWPSLFEFFPELEFDSWYTTPAFFPNTGEEGCPGFAEIDNQDRYLRGVWFDTADIGGGAFVLARYTIVIPEGSPIFPAVVPADEDHDVLIIGTIAGAATSKLGWGDCNTFAFDIVHLCTGDLDGDGDTDQADLGILMADFGCGAIP